MTHTMIWFISLIFTGVATLLGSILYWIKAHNTLGLGKILDTLLFSAPQNRIVSALLIVLLQIGIFMLVRLALRLVVNTLDDTDALPQQNSGITDLIDPDGSNGFGTIQRIGHQLFQSESNGWTRAFTVPLIPILAISAPLIFRGHASASAWGMSLLFVITLLAIRREPTLDPDEE